MAIQNSVLNSITNHPSRGSLQIFPVRCLLLAVWIASLLSACQLFDQNIPFETIENQQSSFTGTLYESEGPAVIGIFSPADAGKLDKIVSANAMKAVGEVDYAQYFAPAVFQGKKPTSGFAVKIERIAKNGPALNIYISQVVITPSYMATVIYTSPYHLVKIPRGDTLKGVNLINVYASEKVIATVPVLSN
jgi:hypothetical protein